MKDQVQQKVKSEAKGEIGEQQHTDMKASLLLRKNTCTKPQKYVWLDWCSLYIFLTLAKWTLHKIALNLEHISWLIGNDVPG